MSAGRHIPAHRKQRSNKGTRGALTDLVSWLPSWRQIATAEALQSSAQIMVGQAFALLGIFAAGVLVARSQGPQSFGLYSAAFALGSLTVGGATAGIPILILRRSAKGDLDSQTLRRALLLLACFLVIAIAITVGIAALVLGGRRGALAGSAASLFFAANNLATLGQYVHVGRRQYLRSAATDIAAGTLFPLLTEAALRLHTAVDGSLVAIALACAISCSIAWTRLPDLEFEKDPTPLRVRDGMSFNAFGLLNGGYGRIDTVTLLAVAGGGAAGFYSAAYRILGPFTLLGNAIAIFYFSRISAYTDNRARWTGARKRGKVVAVIPALVAMAALLIATPNVIHVFYGPHYDSAIGPARVLLLSIIPWSLYFLKPSDLASVHLELRAAAALGFGLLLDFVLVATLGRRFGPVGAAWAWVISESAILIALSVASRRISDRVALPSEATLGSL